MDSLYIDRRCTRPVRELDWKRLLTERQAEVLLALEQVGWSIRFVRSDSGGPRAAVFDPDHRRFAVIEADGRLVEHSLPTFRA